ncbi:MAG: hypothetical protein HEQ22_02895 [Sphingopyxis sp.]|uniref:hypothetical protein n=1 Tax=Sphingopyxis sp. TaxID=1908224 RepID=UPI003D811DE0
MTKMTSTPKQLDDTSLDGVNGGIGLLLPAVQKVREAAAKPAPSVPSDGSVKGIANAGSGNGI